MMAAAPSGRPGRTEELRRWRATFAGTTPIAELDARRHGTAVGVVHRIRLVPGLSLEVTISDGTGSLTAIWTARATLPGLRIGVAMQLSGTVADSAGMPAMRNPDWALVTGPEV